MDVNVLKGEKSSGVNLRKNPQLTLSLNQNFTTTSEFGVTKVLLSKFLEYMPSLDGVLLNREDCKDIRVISKATKFFMVSVKADCYVFSPAVGTKSNTFGTPGILSQEEERIGTTGTNKHNVFFLKQLEHSRAIRNR